VHDSATAAAKMLTDLSGSKFTVDYRAPQTADVVMQNHILENSISTKPDGITIDFLHSNSS
jgi:ribose transport system substrate-binding protein